MTYLADFRFVAEADGAETLHLLHLRGLARIVAGIDVGDVPGTSRNQ